MVHGPILKDILSQNDENSQEKKILLVIKKLSSKTGR